MKSCNYSTIETLGTLEGDGIRFVIFLQGCSKRCLYCHNPETWSFEEKNTIELEALVHKIKRYKPYFKNKGGVTISGGECLHQSDFINELFVRLKEEKIHTCLDTSGFILTDRVKDVLENTDLVLLDVKAVDEKAYYDLCASSFEEVILFLEYLNHKNFKTIIRHVIIPNYNDTIEHVEKLFEILKFYTCIKEIELLGFHNYGKEKYETLKIPYSLKEVENLENTKLVLLQHRLSELFTKQNENNGLK